MLLTDSLKNWLGSDPERARIELHRELVKEYGLRSFIQLGWHTVEGRKPFVGGWHIDAIAEHLEAVSRGQIRQLIINMPPRHMKSTQVSVMWPVWDWIDNPWRQWLFASYAQDLAIRDSVKCRRVLTSPWFQDRWGDRFSLTGDQNAKQRFQNDQGGYRLVSSVDSKLTGEGGDIICIDDPHNVRDADSDQVRTGTLKWWDEAMSTRLNDPQTGAYVIIMQRVHEEDLTGHILANEHGWDHLCLPAEFERAHPFPTRSSLGFVDPRKDDGDLLWPNRFGRKEIDKLKARLKTKASGQLQQRPSPEEGAILKRTYWQPWADKDPPEPTFAFASIDTAYTAKEENDCSACTVWYVYVDDLGNTRLLLRYAWRERLEFNDLVVQIKETADHFKLDKLLIETKASGISVIQELRRRCPELSVHGVNPTGEGDKIARAHAVTSVMASGSVMAMVELDENEKPKIDSSGKPIWRRWASMVIDECAAFPTSKTKDITDTVTQALNWIRKSGIELYEEDAPPPPPVQARGALY